MKILTILIGAFATTLVVPGCNSASFHDCAISCTPSSGCPGGLTCESEGYCRVEGFSSSCDDVRDAALSYDSSPDDPDASVSCSCSNASTLSCPGGDTTCALGCSSAPDPHCRQVVPSNGLELDQIDEVDTTITISGGTATFDTDTGAITGVITRAAGEGVTGGIGFKVDVDTTPIGVFTFHQLIVVGTGKVRFTGTRAAAFIVETQAMIDGLIDGSGGCNANNPSCAGPGAGTGGGVVPATGCGAGGAGGTEGTATSGDAGGGGGGGQLAGAPGGMGGTIAGAPGGAACLSFDAEPLVGGSGGGTGGIGGAPAPARAGGGGGGFQLTALEQVAITGKVTMGGAGGAGGPAGAGGSNAAGAGGGGAGGAILIEAPAVTISGVVAANGGGGGGGGIGATDGGDGANGAPSATPAPGGLPAMTSMGHGGAGGAGAVVSQPGLADTSNGGGGGGAVGVIFIRTGSTPTLQGAVISPMTGTGTIRSN